jgi:hypothetical protein
MNTILIATIAITSAIHSFACETQTIPDAVYPESRPTEIESVIESIELSAEQLLQTRLLRISPDKLFDAEAISRLGWKESGTLQSADFNSLMLAVHDSTMKHP